MGRKRDMNIQQGTGAAASLLAGCALCAGSANEAGLAKLPALLLAAAACAALLLLYRLALRRPGHDYHVCAWDTLTCAGLLILIAWFIFGVISLWAEVMSMDNCFWLYALLPLFLLLLAAAVGEKAVMRCAPILCLFMLAVLAADSIFLVSHIDVTAFAWRFPVRSTAFWRDAGMLFLCLFAPGSVWLLCRLLFPAPGCGRAQTAGLAAAAVYLVLQLLRDLLLFGDLIAFDAYPMLRTLRSVDTGVGVSRLEFFGLIALSMIACLGIMLAFCGVCRLVSRQDGKKSYRPAAGAGAVYLLVLLFRGAGAAAAPTWAASGSALLIAGSLLSRFARKK